MKKIILGVAAAVVAFASAAGVQARDTRPAFLVLSSAAVPAASAAADTGVAAEQGGSGLAGFGGKKGLSKGVLIGGGAIGVAGIVALAASGGDGDKSPN